MVAILGRIKRALDVVDVGRNQQASFERQVVPMQCGEYRCGREREVDLRRDASSSHLTHPLQERRGQVGRVHKVEAQMSRVNRADHGVRGDLFACLKNDACRHTLVGQHTGNPRLRSNQRAGRFCQFSQRLSQCARPADHGDTATNGHRVFGHAVEEHCAGSGRPWTEQMPEDPAHAHRSLDEIMFEPLCHQVRHGHGRISREAAQIASA